MYEVKNLNISFARSGRGYKLNKDYNTGRLIIPMKWLNDLGITPDNRAVRVIYEDNKIIIEKPEV